MNRKIKALGLALVAAFAMSALVASAAQAQFHSSTAHTSLSGTQTVGHVFTVTGGAANVTCTTADFSGTSTATTQESLTITATYSGCKDSILGRTTHVTPAEYTFTPPVNPTDEAQVHLLNEVTIEMTTGCTVHIPPQTVGGIVFHSSGGDVTVTTNSSGVKTVTTGSFFSCGVLEGSHSGGTYTGTTTMEGKNTAGEKVSISVS